MVAYEDMTADERDRFVYLILGERGIEAVTLIMRRRHGPAVTAEQVMRFAFKVAMKRALGAATAKAAAASGSTPPLKPSAGS